MSLGGLGTDTVQVVAALRAVAGVSDAEILPDPSGGPGTLRLQLTAGADEVLVATTVHRLLGDRFGLGVDAGRVQVVEEALPRRTLESIAHVAGKVGDADEPAGSVATAAAQPVDEAPSAEAAEDRGARLLIQRMQLVSAREGVTSEVTLEIDGRAHTGSAGAASTPSSVHRSVALATLRAVEEAVGGELRFELEHLETTSLGTDRAIVVEISMITKYGSERLTGVSAVREDARQAVIRATLDALNRRIETYLVFA
ncbi:MAG TPA: hypothetical protein VIJ54_10715 [Actinomycetes bacterium]